MRKLIAGAVAAAFLACGIEIAVLKGRLRQRDADLGRAVEEKALALGAVKGELANERQLTARLADENRQFVAKLKAVDRRVRPAEHTTTTLEVQGPVMLPDPRFVLAPDFKSLTRHEMFKLDAVIVVGPNGARLLRQTVAELDPATGEVIPGEAPKIVTSFQFVTEAPAAPPLFHPRAVAVVASTGAPGLGVELLNLERAGGVWSHANLSLVGVYNPRTQKADAGIVLGFRPFNWNVSVGPAYLYPSRTLGAAITIELTR